MNGRSIDPGKSRTGRTTGSAVILGRFPLILLFIGTLYYLAYYYLIPGVLKLTSEPYLVAYLWVWAGSMGIILAISLFLYLLEGQPFAWKPFTARYRLERMPGKDWLWALAVLIVTTGCYFGLSGTARWLASVPVFAPHSLAPAELRPDATGNLIPGQFFGMAIQGQWWVVIVYFIGWIFNILGEEFFYRGWMLPRQELAFGKYAYPKLHSWLPGDLPIGRMLSFSFGVRDISGALQDSMNMPRVDNWIETGLTHVTSDLFFFYRQAQ